MSNGGRAALGGFLYQMIGILGLKTWAEIFFDDPLNSPELDALFKTVVDGSLLHELHDQDGVINKFGITQEDECIFFQFKYTSNPSPGTIGQSDLWEIINKLLVGKRKAEQQGQTATNYFLITNRRLGPTAIDLINRAKNSSHPDEEQQILKKISTHELSQQQFEDKLICYGRSFGLDDSEISNGISKLIGNLLRNTAGGIPHPIVIQDIIEAFTGSRDKVFNCRISHVY